MIVKRPLVFLAFANDMDSHLATLKDESRAVSDMLQLLERKDTIDVHCADSTKFDELYNELLEFNGRIAVFHYAGHADGTILQLEGRNGGASSIAKLLGQQTCLKLVFLNGCATKGQVQLLFDAGVPAVVATAVKINDTQATQFSTTFYAALVKGHSIFKAFESARAYIEGKFNTYATINFSINRHPDFNHAQHEHENDQSLEFEWTLYAREDCVADLEQWRITHAQKEWLLELHDSNGKIRDIENNPIKIQHQVRARTVDVLACLNCHSTTSINDENQLQCPLCLSRNVEQQHGQSNIPEFDLPFNIDKQQARDIALAAVGFAGTKKIKSANISLRKVYIPFWVFDISTRSHLSAQRGVIKNIDAEILALAWQDITEDIDLGFESLMVPGFTGQTMVSVNGGDRVDWHWSLNENIDIFQLNSSIPFIPFEVSPQAGFNTLVEHLSEKLAAEVCVRIGSQQQKNIVLNTRYKHLSISSLFLPHWCAVINHGQQTSSIIINGQTGEIRFSPSPNKPALTSLGRSLMDPKRSIKGSATNNTSSWASLFRGMGIGIMVGLLIGLVAS